MQRSNRSNVYCCVPQCHTFYRKGISFHTFPIKNKPLSDKWAEALKISRKVSSSMRVCSRHFAKDAYFYCTPLKQKHRLKLNAVPSVNLPDTDSHIRRARADKRQRILIEKRKVLDGKQDLKISDGILPHSDAELQAARMLVCLTEVEPEAEKLPYQTFEDKAVQVNLEDFNNFDISHLIDNNHKLEALCGISNLALLNLLVGAIAGLKATKFKLSANKLIILTLMRLRLDLSFTALGIMFRITAPKARTYFQTTIRLLSSLLKVLIRFPSKDEVLRNTPSSFKVFKHTRVVLSCVELKIQKAYPSSYTLRGYSFGKGKNTVKFMLGSAPSGLITYLSKPYGGQASCGILFTRENLISLLNHPDAVMANKHFLIEKECQQKNVILLQPSRKKRSRLTRGEAHFNADIAQAYSHVERNIRKLKFFKICQNVIPWTLLPFLQDIMTVIAALTNLSGFTIVENR